MILKVQVVQVVQVPDSKVMVQVQVVQVQVVQAPDSKVMVQVQVV